MPILGLQLQGTRCTPLRPCSKGQQPSCIQRQFVSRHNGGAPSSVDHSLLLAPEPVVWRMDHQSISRCVLTSASAQPGEKATKVENSALYQRLGGSDGIDAVVKIFYSKVYSDSRVKKWFEGVSQERQMKKMARFVRFATGSGEEYGQMDLGRPHAKLVERGLRDRDYDVIVELFTEAMADAGVPEDEASEVATLLESVRDPVLGRK